MKIVKKNSEIEQFVKSSEAMLNDAEFNKTKFAHSLKKQVKVAKDVLVKYNEDIHDHRIDFCSVDEKQNIIIENGIHYKFTKENLKAFNKKVKEEGEKTQEFEFLLDLETMPETAPDYYKEFFESFLEGIL